MRRNIVYLEAADRTQDLLNMKWALRSAGYTIASKWHDLEGNIGCPNFKSHGSPEELDGLRMCQLLVVLAGQSQEAAVQMGLMAGFAVACGIEVWWLGRTLGHLSQLPGVQIFDTADEIRTYIVKLASAQIAVPERLAA